MRGDVEPSGEEIDEQSARLERRARTVQEEQRRTVPTALVIDAEAVDVDLGHASRIWERGIARNRRRGWVASRHGRSPARRHREPRDRVGPASQPRRHPGRVHGHPRRPRAQPLRLPRAGRRERRHGRCRRALGRRHQRGASRAGRATGASRSRAAPSTTTRRSPRFTSSRPEAGPRPSSARARRHRRSSSGLPTARGSRSSRAIPTGSATACRGGDRKEKDMSPRRIERLFTRLDSEGWITDRPSRVFVVDAAGGVGAPGRHRRRLRSGRRRVVARQPAPCIRLGTSRLVGHRLGRRPVRRRRCGRRAAPRSRRPGRTTRAAFVVTRRLAPRLHPSTFGDRRPVERADRGRRRRPRRRSGAHGGDRPELRALSRVRVGRSGAATTSSSCSSRAGARISGVPRTSCEPVIAGDRLLSGFDAVGDTIAFVASSPTALAELFVSTGGRETQITDLTAGLTADGPIDRGAGSVHRVARRRCRRRLLDHRARARPRRAGAVAAQHPRRSVLALREPLLRRVPARGRRGLRRCFLQPARVGELLAGVGTRASAGPNARPIRARAGAASTTTTSWRASTKR